MYSTGNLPQELDDSSVQNHKEVTGKNDESNLINLHYIHWIHHENVLKTNYSQDIDVDLNVHYVDQNEILDCVYYSQCGKCPASKAIIYKKPNK